MFSSQLLRVGAVCGIALLSLSACASNENGAPESSSSQAAVQGTLAGSGASSQASAQEAWIASFQTTNERATVHYEPSGSGAGRETFQQGASSFAGSDRAFTPEEISAGGFASCAPDSSIVEFPAYISPIALITNVTGVNSLQLDAPTIAQIFSGSITRWNDPAIRAHNPGVTLPDERIVPVHRSDKSGTTQNFTDYLSAAAPKAWTAGAVEEWPKALGGEAAQGTSGVVEAVTQGVGTIGYADASRAGSLTTVAVQVGKTYTKYSPEAAAAIIDASPLETGRGANDLVIAIDRTSEAKNVYPIVLVSYIIGCEHYQDANQAALSQAYFTALASAEGQQLAAQATGSAPLPTALLGKIRAAIQEIH